MWFSPKGCHNLLNFLYSPFIILSSPLIASGTFLQIILYVIKSQTTRAVIFHVACRPTILFLVTNPELSTARSFAVHTKSGDFLVTDDRLQKHWCGFPHPRSQQHSHFVHQERCDNSLFILRDKSLPFPLFDVFTMCSAFTPSRAFCCRGQSVSLQQMMFLWTHCRVSERHGHCGTWSWSLSKGENYEALPLSPRISHLRQEP